MPLTGFRCCLLDFGIKAAAFPKQQVEISRKWSPNTKTSRTQGARAEALLHFASTVGPGRCFASRPAFLFQ